MPAATPHAPLAMAAPELPTAWHPVQEPALVSAKAMGPRACVLARDTVVGQGNKAYGSMLEPPRGTLPNMNMYELVPGRRLRHMLLDVDCKESTFKGFNAEDVISVLRANVEALHGTGELPVQIMTASGAVDGDYKHSFHVVFPTTSFTHLGLRAFVKLLEERLKPFNYPVGVPDFSIYTVNRAMRALGQSKLGSDRVLVPYGASSDDAFDHLWCIYEERNRDVVEVTWTDPTPPPPPYVAPVREFATMEARELFSKCEDLIDCLSVERATKYDTWFGVGSAAYHISNGDPAFLDLWDAWSRKQAPNSYSFGCCDEKWRTMARPTGGATNGMGSLRYWAKMDDPAAFADIVNAEREEREAATSADLTQALATLAVTPASVDAATSPQPPQLRDDVVTMVDALANNVTHQSVADVIHAMNKGTIVHVGEKQWYKWTGLKWLQIVDINVHALFVDLNTKVIERMAWWNSAAGRNGQSDNLIKGLADVCKKSLGNSTFSSSAIVRLKALTNDIKFVNELDKNPNLIGFDDGVFDLASNTFRRMTPTDMVSKSVGYTFPSVEEVAAYEPRVMAVLRSIFDADLLQYVLRVFASQLCGSLRYEAIYVLTGSGGNGKGILQDLLKAALGENDAGGYFASVPAELWTGKSKSAESASPVLAKLKGVRVSMASEPESGEESKLQVGKLKTFSGNDMITARALYGTPISYKPQCTINIMCNDIPDLSRMDGGIKRRLRIIPFKYQFKESQADIDDDVSGKPCKLGDSTLKGRIAAEPGFGHAFMAILLRVYAANRDAQSIPMPGEAQSATTGYIMENSKVVAWLDEAYTRTHDDTDRVSAADLLNEYKEATGDARMTATAFGRELANAGVQKIRSNGYSYTGLKLNVDV